MKDFTEPVFFRNRTKFIVLPDVIGDIALLTATTPNVKGRNVLVFKNTIATAITNLLGGAAYQTIRLIGDGFTTMKNNVNIINNTGVDRLLANNRAYNYTLINNVWIEDAD